MTLLELLGSSILVVTMSLIRGIKCSHCYPYAQVFEFEGLILRGYDRSVRIINQLMEEDPTLSFTVNAKLTRTHVKPSKMQKIDLPVVDVVVHGPPPPVLGSRSSDVPRGD